MKVLTEKCAWQITVAWICWQNHIVIDTQLTYEVLDVIDVLSFEIYFKQAIPRKKKETKNQVSLPRL